MGEEVLLEVCVVDAEVDGEFVNVSVVDTGTAGADNETEAVDGLGYM